MKANPIKSCRGCTDAAVRAKMPHEEQCNACRKKELNRKWRLANPGAMAANARKWREAGNKNVRPEGYEEQQRLKKLEKYRNDPEHREKAKAAAKQRRLEKPDIVKAETKSWMERNRPAVRRYQSDYQRERRASDPEFHQRLLTAQSMWRIRHWAKDPQSNSWIRHLENQSIDPVWRQRLHVWQDNRCYMCNKKDNNMTIEHIIPRSRSGPTVKQNIVYTCSSCNYSRRALIWGTEWQPRNVDTSLTDLTVTYKTISHALREAGLEAAENGRGGFRIHSDKRASSRDLYILSTFAASERNVSSRDGRFACILRDADPNAIILFDYEWYARAKAVLNMLRSKMGIAEKGIGARELSVVEVSAEDATVFLRDHHVMGAVDAPFRIGLANGEMLCGVGLFADHGDSYECVRLAFRGHVPGGMTRIIQGLRRLHGNRPVTSFIDTRYATGAGHGTVGFTYEGRTEETYLWVLPDRVQHQRYLSNDNKMSRNLLYFNPDLPREKNIRANGIFKVWVPPRAKMLLA